MDDKLYDSHAGDDVWSRIRVFGAMVITTASLQPDVSPGYATSAVARELADVALGKIQVYR